LLWVLEPADTPMNEFRIAVRNLQRQPGFLLTTVLSLALGIGLVATQYSLIDGVLLRPLPFPDGERIWHVARALNNLDRGWRPVMLDEFVAQREQQVSFDKLAAFRAGSYNLVSGSGAPQRMWGSAVDQAFFDLLGVRPLLGRSFLRGEDSAGQPLRAVIGFALWRDGFGSDPAVLGRSVQLNGESAEIIGVMPEGFVFPSTESVWVNLRLPAPGAAVGPDNSVEGLGLLKSGVAVDAAGTELELAAQRFRAAQGLPVDDVPRLRVQRMQRAYNGGATQTLFGAMLAMTVFVLLLACINVANLLFVRGADRARELAVRAALGAGRGRIVRQLLVESLVIAALGALAGIALAAVGVSLLQSQVSARVDVAGWMYFDLNPRVLAVAIGASALAGVLAGGLPALRAARIDLAQVLRADGRGSVGGGPGRTRGWLAAGQLAFACTALVIATLLATSVARTGKLTLAYDPESLLIGRIELQGPAYADAASRGRFYAQLVERVAATPGVAAAAASSRDLVQPGVLSSLRIAGETYPRAQDMPEAQLEVVTRDYFAVVGQRAIAGRMFDTRDRVDSAPVALVNQSFAARHFDGRDPHGMRIQRGTPDAPWATVIGVVPDLNMQGVGNGGSGAGWYLLHDQVGWGWMELLVRATDGHAAALGDAVRTAVAAVDSEQPVHTIRTLSERADRGLAGLSIMSGMASVFGAAALLLAAIGVFGVVAYGARMRGREFGLRIALGASRRGVIGLLLRQNAAVALAGIATGIGGGFVLSRPLAPLLPAVSADDPWIYCAVAAVLVATTALACWLPARRAASVDPLSALRGD